MWVKLVISVTLLPMLVHSILGCCWHHAHSKYNLPCSQAQAQSAVGHSHESCHRHADDQPDGHSEPISPAPCKHGEPCDDTDCVYIAADPVRGTYAFDSFEPAIELAAGCNVHFCMPFAAAKNLHQNHKIEAALQHCALNQVWVI